MARTKEFDEAQALSQALEVFWDKGYSGASLVDLTLAMGISKSSLYETFGSKHDLFLAALEQYSAHALAEWICNVSEGKTPMEAIQALFRGVVEVVSSPEEHRGCFVSNCAGETGFPDGPQPSEVLRGLQAFEDSFYGLVREAQTSGELAASHDPRALARYLSSSLQGLHVMAKGKPEARVLEDIVNVTLSVLT